MAADDANIRQRLAQALEAMAVDTEAVGTILCDDHALCDRFAHELQAIDRLAQLQRVIAQMLRAPSLDSAEQLCSIGALREQLFGADHARANGSHDDRGGAFG